MTAGPRPLAVVDIDGVVADVRHRLHHLQSRPKDWDAFFIAAAQDPPLEQGVLMVHALAVEHDVVWLTGRPARNRGTTLTWLGAQGLPTEELHMRADRDHRPAPQAKADLLRGLAVGRSVSLVLDDDLEVIAALGALGWPVAHADWAPATRREQRTLSRAQDADGRT